MTETLDTRADYVRVGSVIVEPADGHERRWAVVDRELADHSDGVILWFERIGGDDPKTYRRTFYNDDMLAVAVAPAVDPEKVKQAHFAAVAADEFDRTGDFAASVRAAREVAGYPDPEADPEADPEVHSGVAEGATVRGRLAYGGPVTGVAEYRTRPPAIPEGFTMEGRAFPAAGRGTDPGTGTYDGVTVTTVPAS